MKSTDPHDDRLLRSKVIAWLAKTGCEPASVIEMRMQKTLPTLKAIDYSVFLEEHFSAAILYLPNALQYAREMREGYDHVAVKIVFFLGSGEDELRQLALFDLVVDELQLLLFTWSSNYDPMKVTVDEQGDVLLNPGTHLYEGIDSFLDALLTSKVKHGQISVFAHILEKWARETASAESSASFLDLALRVRCYPSDDPIYRDPVMLRLVFDEPTLRRHWERAADLIARRCSAAYRDTLRSCLFSRN